PGAAQGVEPKRVVAARRFLRTAQHRASRVSAVEEPLEHRERVVRGDAMCVRAGTDSHTELLTGDDRWLATNRFRSLTFQHFVAGVVPRILNGPADSKRFHPS